MSHIRKLIATNKVLRTAVFRYFEISGQSGLIMPNRKQRFYQDNLRLTASELNCVSNPSRGDQLRD